METAHNLNLNFSRFVTRSFRTLDPSRKNRSEASCQGRDDTTGKRHQTNTVTDLFGLSWDGYR